jgi:hypothetical protein
VGAEPPQNNLLHIDYTRAFSKSGGVRGGTPINLPGEKYQITHMQLPYRLCGFALFADTGTIQ